MGKTSSDSAALREYAAYLHRAGNHASAAYFTYLAKVCSYYNCTVLVPSRFNECYEARMRDKGFHYFQVYRKLPDRTLCRCCYTEDGRSYSPGFDDSSPSTGKKYPRTIFTKIVKETDVNVRVNDEEVKLDCSRFKR